MANSTLEGTFESNHPLELKILFYAAFLISLPLTVFGKFLISLSLTVCIKLSFHLLQLDSNSLAGRCRV